MGRRARIVLLIAIALVVTGCGQMRPPGRKEYLIRHTVEKGDTLYSIAWSYGYDFREVAAWNKIKAPYEIYPGEEILIIPPDRFTGPRERPAAPPPTAVASAVPDYRASATPAPTMEPVPVAPPVTPHHRPKPRVRITHHAPKLQSKPSKTQSSDVVHWRWPTEGKLVARFSPSAGKKGIDIKGEVGQAVRAAASGDVVYSGNGLIGFGNLLIIKHDDEYLSAYAHNKKLLVKEGDRVSRGEKIAEMGQTSKSGSILYFEIRRNGKPVDPLHYLPQTKL